MLKSEIIKADGAITGKFIGGIIKRTSAKVFEGRAIRWHDPNRMDLEGEWFSKRTNRMLKQGYPIIGAPVNYQHNMHKDFGTIPIGLLTFTDEDEIGQMVRGEINELKEYEAMLEEIGRVRGIKISPIQIRNHASLAVKAVDDLLNDVEMRFSGGFDPSTWVVNPDNNHIDQAGLIHLAFTPTPADDLNPIVRFKSVWHKVQDLENERKTFDMSIPVKAQVDDNGHSGVQADKDNAAQQLTDTSTKEQDMTPEEIMAMIQENLPALVEEILSQRDGGDSERAMDEEEVEEVTDAVRAEVDDMDEEDKKSLDATVAAKLTAKHVINILEKRQAQKSAFLNAGRKESIARGQGLAKKSKVDTGRHTEDTTMLDDGYVSKTFKGVPNIDSGFARRVDATPLLMSVKAQLGRYGWDDDVRKYQKSSGIIGANIDFLGTPAVREEMLDELLPMTFLDKVGAMITTVDGNQTVERPKLTLSPKAEWLGENDTVVGGEHQAELLLATPKPLMAEYRLPLSALERMDARAESLLRTNLLKRFALAINEAALRGIGAVNTGTVQASQNSTGKQPLGILNAIPSAQKPNLSTNGRAPTPKDMTDMKSAVEARDVELSSSTHWVYHANVLNYFEDLTDTTGQLLNASQWKKGFEPVTTNIALTNLGVGSGTNLTRIYFGDWQYFESVQSKDFKLRVLDDAFYARKLQVGVIAWTFVDFLIHYLEAFEVRQAVSV